MDEGAVEVEEGDELEDVAEGVEETVDVRVEAEGELGEHAEEEAVHEVTARLLLRDDPSPSNREGAEDQADHEEHPRRRS